jgi:hypothetical protein
MCAPLKVDHVRQHDTVHDKGKSSASSRMGAMSLVGIHDSLEISKNSLKPCSAVTSPIFPKACLLKISSSGLPCVLPQQVYHKITWFTRACISVWIWTRSLIPTGKSGE